MTLYPLRVEQVIQRPEAVARLAPGCQPRTGDMGFLWSQVLRCTAVGVDNHFCHLGGDAVLAHHPAVHQAVIALREATPGDEYMAAYIVTDQVLTSDAIRDAVDRTFQNYRTPVETALAELWAELLGLARVGVHDDFFSLGGHALLAMPVSARIRGLCGVEVPLRSFLAAPTIAHTATVTAQGLASAAVGEDCSSLLVEIEQSSEHEAHCQLRQTIK